MSTTLKYSKKKHSENSRFEMTSNPLLEPVRGDVLLDQDVQRSFTQEEVEMRERSRRRRTRAMLARA